MRKALERREKEGALRSTKIFRGLADFCSNDYLGFSSTGALHDKVYSFARSMEGQVMEGSTGSRLISGNSAMAESLEEYIASCHNAEAALLFNSGYDANIGFFSSLPKRGDTVLYDELVHASIRDGIRMGFAKSFSFRHNDIEDFEKLINKASGNVYVVVESVYSMDGDMAPLKQLSGICEKNNFHLIVDEAHATGVFGTFGKGLVCEYALEKKIFARLHTFGKALGTHGGAIVGSKLLREYLLNFARSFIFTTALPYHSLFSIKCAYTLLQESDEIISSLHENIHKFRSLMSGVDGLMKSKSPIQCILVSGNSNVTAIAAHLVNKGFDIKPIMSPTVPKGKERLRICIHAFNSEDEIKALVQEIKIKLTS
ncbi:MAG: pyridoxal phosphate-dependent aminotransferase family protein [Bacteroidota bacterium]